MTQGNEYSEEQIETVRQQTTIITQQKQKKGPTGNGSGVVRTDVSPGNPLIGWKAGNSSLPPGWKIKRHEYANQTVYFYMSPKGDIIKSRRAVMDYMFADGGYAEKDFNIVISGAKQRKVALQELYDARMRRRRKKRSRSDAVEEEEEEEFDEETDDPKIDSDEELDPVEDDDKFEDAKKCHKKNKPEKEPVLPTRRSGRIRIKEEKQKEEEQESGAEDSESESESVSPGTVAGGQFPTKRRWEEQESEQDMPEPKRKRGRPPKALSQSFELIELKGESEEEMIADTLLKVEQNMGDSLVKLDSSLFKVELSSKEEILDFDLAGATEIKMEDVAPHPDNINHGASPAHSIHSNQSPAGNNRVNEVSKFYVSGCSDYQVSTKFVREEIYKNTSVENSSQPTATENSSYGVVVNVLKDIVSSISD